MRFYFNLHFSCFWMLLLFWAITQLDIFEIFIDDYTGSSLLLAFAANFLMDVYYLFGNSIFWEKQSLNYIPYWQWSLMCLISDLILTKLSLLLYGIKLSKPIWSDDFFLTQDFVDSYLLLTSSSSQPFSSLVLIIWICLVP